MSNAIKQSATDLAISPNGEAQFDFTACASRQAYKSAKGATRERQMLNRHKLIQYCVGDYRMHFAAIYGKTEKLPRDIFEKIEAAVDEHITKQLKEVNALNVVSYRRAFAHIPRQAEVVERVTIVGENKLVLKEQLLGVDIFIHAAEKRLKDLMAKPTPNFEREKSFQQQIMQLNLTKQYILGEIANQDKLAKEASQTETSS